jgi:ABC-2 type transport system permease protein
MRVFLTLLRRELGTYFFSLTGYVIITAVSFLAGLGMVVLMHKLGNAPTPRPVTEMFHETPFFWLILILASPVITMRLFALEKYSGTYETLMTVPVSDVQVVSAKFSAAWLFYLVMWLPLLGCLYVVQHYARQSGALDPATVGGMFLGIALVGALFMALGCLASALTSSQMVAAMVTLTSGVALFALAYLADQVAAGGDWHTQVLAHFALFQKMNTFARGVVDVRSVVFFLSLTMFFLFLTLRAVESRRWK